MCARCALIIFLIFLIGFYLGRKMGFCPRAEKIASIASKLTGENSIRFQEYRDITGGGDAAEYVRMKNFARDGILTAGVADSYLHGTGGA